MKDNKILDNGSIACKSWTTTEYIYATAVNALLNNGVPAISTVQFKMYRDLAEVPMMAVIIVGGGCNINMMLRTTGLDFLDGLTCLAGDIAPILDSIIKAYNDSCCRSLWLLNVADLMAGGG